ncbi:5-methyltetrahydropteroyltriglutamate--homocysteine methyltransferase-like [Eucalyptus grandis]|uniref:5-methyltetrahydropteroyltriglutamate-- homocysteine methyltransferase-like n=1 Tax=Eucalyptus grandis TaxID=71139 RepID=UPI00192EA91B|nr:5-methyltetrahydropteroyltriglutamate--homocysteine methyltransferase-like [Eucalyptus grandis]
MEVVGDTDLAFFSANAAAQASRKSSPRVTNEAVQKAAAALEGYDHRRATTVSARTDAQQKKLTLPVVPTTTIGSFPQSEELRRVHCERMSWEEYVKAIKEEIKKVVKLQQEPDVDVLDHGELGRNDMVEYSEEQLSGLAFTVNGLKTCYKIALAIKDKVEDLEKAGINVIQIDEAALREGLPPKIHTHLYSHFNDIIHSIIDMDADIITIENSHSDEKLLFVFCKGVEFVTGIGPSVYHIHSLIMPSTEEIADKTTKMLATNMLWFNPEFLLKTRSVETQDNELAIAKVKVVLS